jgi:hypothetical protein
MTEEILKIHAALEEIENGVDKAKGQGQGQEKEEGSYEEI